MASRQVRVTLIPKPDKSDYTEAKVYVLSAHHISIWECHQSFVQLAKHTRLQLISVLCHKGIVGNETANHLAKLDSTVCLYDLNHLVKSQ
jgi:hypothetical protein